MTTIGDGSPIRRVDEVLEPPRELGLIACWLGGVDGDFGWSLHTRQDFAVVDDQVAKKHTCVHFCCKGRGDRGPLLNAAKIVR
jgi:hypothetical protein